MVWFFERDEDNVRIETRYDQTRKVYVLIQDRDGARHEERFTDVEGFRAKLVALENEFKSGHWTRHGPVFLRDGWKL